MNPIFVVLPLRTNLPNCRQVLECGDAAKRSRRFGLVTRMDRIDQTRRRKSGESLRSSPHSIALADTTHIHRRQPVNLFNGSRRWS